MLQQGDIVLVKELLVMDKTKRVVISIKVKDKKYDVYEQESLVGTKEKGVYRKGYETVVGEKVVQVEEKIVVQRELMKKLW